MLISIIILTHFTSIERCNAAQLRDEILQNIKILLDTNSCVQCDLSGANLTRAQLANSDLRGANLKKATFSLANLAGANFQHSNLQGAEFGGADISEADFRGANITGTSFTAAYMRGSVFEWREQDDKSSMIPVSRSKISEETAKQNIESSNVSQSLPDNPDNSSSSEIQPVGSKAPAVKRIQPVSKVKIK